MDNKKREEILRLLEANARYTPKDIAVMLGLGLEETENEIKQMEKEHVICGYHALVNWDKTDDEKISALIELKVMPQRGHTASNRSSSSLFRFASAFSKKPPSSPASSPKSMFGSCFLYFVMQVAHRLRSCFSPFTNVVR